jgi:hypothetical protein
MLKLRSDDGIITSPRTYHSRYLVQEVPSPPRAQRCRVDAQSVAGCLCYASEFERATLEFESPDRLCSAVHALAIQDQRTCATYARVRKQYEECLSPARTCRAPRASSLVSGPSPGADFRPNKAMYLTM